MLLQRQTPLSIPQDIIYNITSSLSGDYYTLKNCCSVSRLFLAPSRKELYSIIRLRRYDEDSMRILYETLATQPDFFSYIRTFHVSGLGWGLDEADFLFLLRTITKLGLLRTFTLDTQYSNGTWEALPAPTRMAVLELFISSPELHTVRLTNLCGETFPVQVFAFVPELKHLTFVGYHSERDCPHTRSWDAPAQDVFLPQPGPRETYLETLEVSQINSTRLVEHASNPDCPIRLSRLRELRIHKAGHDLLEAAWEVMKLSHNLESLIWYNVDISANSLALTHTPAHSELYPRKSPFDLTLLSNLTSLILHRSQTRKEPLLDVLRHCGVPPNLSNLSLVYPYVPKDLFDEAELKTQLMAEDKVFANLWDSGVVRRLKKLEVVVVLPKQNSKELGGGLVMARLKEWVPCLWRSEIGVTSLAGVGDIV